jgi:hypothetical protein
MIKSDRVSPTSDIAIAQSGKESKRELTYSTAILLKILQVLNNNSSTET